MKQASILVVGIFIILMYSVSQTACNQAAAIKQDSVANEPKTLSHTELEARGKYLATTGACGDCHSPKNFTAQGPVEDSSKLLSGHPGGIPALAIDKKTLQPGNWMLIGPDLTSFVGPWGISFTANLTPDSTTGIGAWTEDVFIKTLRSGKHLGQPGGRPILPPMPWPGIGQLTDQDLKSLFAYLQSIPAISNKVPGPVPPPEVAKMK